MHMNTHIGFGNIFYQIIIIKVEEGKALDSQTVSLCDHTGFVSVVLQGVSKNELDVSQVSGKKRSSLAGNDRCLIKP